MTQPASKPAPQPRTELTPIGEQFVIPGCEKQQPPKIKQLGLWD